MATPDENNARSEGSDLDVGAEGKSSPDASAASLSLTSQPKPGQDDRDDAIAVTPERSTQGNGAEASGAADLEITGFGSSINDGPGPPADLKSASVELPPPLPLFATGELIGLVLAMAVHVAALASTLNPDNRLGAGLGTRDAINVDLVVLASALEGRIGSARDAKNGDGMGDGSLSDDQSAQTDAQTAAADLRQTVEVPRVEQAPTKPLPADQSLTPPLSPETSQAEPTDDQTPAPLPGLVLRDPVASADATDPNIVPRDPLSIAKPAPPPPIRPSLLGSNPSPDNSAGAEASEQSVSGLSGGAGEAINATAAALELSRAGRRDRYAATVYAALRDNLPAPIRGGSGKVTIEFGVAPDGTAARTRVAISSGNSRVDDTALATVRSTRFLTPPADLPPSSLTYRMEYTFTDEPNKQSSPQQPR